MCRLFFGWFREAGYVRLTTDLRMPPALHARSSLTPLSYIEQGHP